MYEQARLHEVVHFGRGRHAAAEWVGPERRLRAGAGWLRRRRDRVNLDGVYGGVRQLADG